MDLDSSYITYTHTHVVESAPVVDPIEVKALRDKIEILQAMLREALGDEKYQKVLQIVQVRRRLESP